PTTGLPNRARFVRHVDDLLPTLLGRQSDMALLHISCGQIRGTRETLGSRAADALLRQAGVRLSQIQSIDNGREIVRLKPEQLLTARVGDQDFALGLADLPNADAGALLAKEVLQAFSTHFEVEGHEIFLSPSIGISLAPTDGQYAEALLHCANVACAKAVNSQGKSRYEFFSEELTARSLERLTVTAQLRRGLEHDELRLYYQPKVCLRTGRIVGAEALVRWQHPEHGLLLPGRFIGVAEESGLIGPLGEWVTREAVRQAAQWQAAGMPPLYI